MRALLSLIIGLWLIAGAPARAQLPASIDVLVGFGPGQGNDQPARPDASVFAANRMSPDMSYDQTARFLARRMPAYLRSPELPGGPRMEARHVPGGAGFEVARRLAAAPADGRMVALLSANILFASALRLPGASFDASRFAWIGSVAGERWACIRRVAPRPGPIWTGSTGAGSRADVHARAMAVFADAPLAILPGYASRFELIRALEAGEIDAACGWPMRDLETRRSDWFAARRFEPFALFSSGNAGPFAAPTDPVADGVFAALAAEAEIAWPLAGPPGLPAALTQAFADALAALSADPDAQAEAQRAGIVLDPAPAARVAATTARLHALPADASTALTRLFTPTDASPHRPPVPVK